MFKRAIKSIIPRKANNRPALSDIPRYPPYVTGLPAVPVDDLMDSQEELIKKIYNTTRYDKKDFETWYLPAIRNYAELVHLLPASEGHHHRGVGGLFRHGLEVGLFALDKITNFGGNLAMEKEGLQRRRAIPRWELGCFIAGLNHDAGKVVTDLRVTGPGKQGDIWTPFDSSIPVWMAENWFERYFVSFQKNRQHKSHEQMTSLLIDKLISRETRKYLLEGDTEVLQKVIEAFCGFVRGQNIIHDYVVEADQKSVELDLRKNQFTDGISGDVGVPIERNLFDAMRRLVNNGTWTVNEKGSRLWVMQDELHIAWNRGCEDILDMLIKDGIQGIPRDPRTLADILLSRDLAVPYINGGQKNCYWAISPDILQEKGSVTINALRLKVPETLLDVIPKNVSGAINGINPDAPASQAPDNGEQNEPEGEAASREDLPSPVETQESPESAPAEQTPVESSSTEKPSESSGPEENPKNVNDAPNAATAEIILPGQGQKKSKPQKKKKRGGSPEERQRATAQLVPAEEVQKVERTLSANDQQSYEKATEFLEQTYCGTVLHAVAENLALGWAKWGKGAIQHEGKIALLYPGAFEDTGCDPNGLMEELDKNDWIERHPKHFIRKIQEIKGFGRALVLTETVSQQFLVVAQMPASVTKGTQAPEKTAASQRNVAQTEPCQPKNNTNEKKTKAPQLPKGKSQTVNPQKTKPQNSDPLPKNKVEPVQAAELDLKNLKPSQVAAVKVLHKALTGKEESSLEIIEIDGRRYAKRALVIDWLRNTKNFGRRRALESVGSGCFDIVTHDNCDYVGVK